MQWKTSIEKCSGETLYKIAKVLNVSAWQEAYMEKLNHEYVKLLEGDGVPSEKFWALEKRIKIDKKHKGVLIEMRKQNMPFDLVDLIRDGVIGCKDLEDFSSELLETVNF